MQSDKSWVKPALAAGVAGLLIVAGIAWLLLSKIERKTEPSHQESLYSDDGSGSPSPMRTASSASAAAPQSGQVFQPAAVPGASSSPASQPPAPQSGAMPPPDAAPQGAALPAGGFPPGAPSARANPDSSSGNQSQRRPSMKDRLEKTAPEDRALRQMLRAEEMKYRQSHGGGGGGRGGHP